MPLNFDLAVNTGTEVYQDDYLFDRSYFPYLRSPVPQELRESADIDVRIVAVPFRENDIEHRPTPVNPSTYYHTYEYDLAIDETTRMMADATVLQDLSDRIITIHTVDEVDPTCQTLPLSSLEIVLDNSDLALYDLDSGEMGTLTGLGIITVEWTFSNGVTSHTDKGQPWFIISSISFSDEDFTVTVSMLDTRMLYSGVSIPPYLSTLYTFDTIADQTVPIKDHTILPSEGFVKDSHSLRGNFPSVLGTNFRPDRNEGLELLREHQIPQSCNYFVPGGSMYGRTYSERYTLRSIINSRKIYTSNRLLTDRPDRYEPYTFVPMFFDCYDIHIEQSKVINPPRVDVLNPQSFVECNLHLDYYRAQTGQPVELIEANAYSDREVESKYMRGDRVSFTISYRGTTPSPIGVDYNVATQEMCDAITENIAKYLRTTYVATITGVPECRAGDRVLMEDRLGVMGVYRVLKADTTYDGSVTIDLTMYKMDTVDPNDATKNNTWESVKDVRFQTWGDMQTHEEYVQPTLWGDLLFVNTEI